MKRVQVNVINYLDRIVNLDELLPKEFAVAMGWKEQGILEHLFIKENRTGAVLVFKDIDEDRAKELVPTLPLFPYFKQVEYSTLEKQF